MTFAYALIALVAAERILEVLHSNRNTRALLTRGGVEHAPEQYPVIVALHVAWFAAILFFLPRPLIIWWWALGLFLAMQGLRVWVMLSLGPWFSTRIVTVADEPLVASGLYRLTRHPNYAIVAGEVALLPLVFGEIWVAVGFSVLNAAALAWRIRAEDRALAPRRGLARKGS